MSGVFSEGGATNEAVGTAGSRDGTAAGTGAAGAGRFCAGTDGAGAGGTLAAGATGTAAGAPGVTVAGGAAVETGAGTGDFPAFAPSGRTPAPPAVAGERVSAVPPKDGIDANSRRNPAAARAFLTTHPSKKPPRKQYKCLFYLMNSTLSRVCLQSLSPWNRSLDPWDMAVPLALFHPIGRTRKKIHPAGDPQRITGSYSPPSRERWTDVGSSRVPERISRARSRWSRGIRIASPQSEVRRRGTGIRRNDTPPPFSRFSADRTWWVPRKMRIRTGSAARVNFTVVWYHSRHKPPREGVSHAHNPQIAIIIPR